MKIKYFFLLLIGVMFFHSSNAQNYIITTIAGNGFGAPDTGGFSGDGGQAINAEFNLPRGIALDDSGNIFIADEYNNRIRKINTSGIISTIAGTGYGAPNYGGFSGDGGPATAAELFYPKGLTLDSVGNIYIADWMNNCIRKINTKGIISTFAGKGGTVSGYSGDNGAATAAEMHNPNSVVIDKTGNVIIADEFNERIRVVNSNDIISTIAGNGTAGYSGDNGAATSAELSAPIGVCKDISGSIFISELEENRIRKVNTGGVISTIAGNGFGAPNSGGFSGDGGPATSAELYGPYGIVIAANGNVIFADDGNGRIREIDTKGIITTIAGNGVQGYSGDGGIATSAEMYSPGGVAIDHNGCIYICDVANNRVRKLTLVTGINELANKLGIIVYPNPNMGVFNIQIKARNFNTALVEVYDVLGDKIYGKTYQQNQGDNMQVDLGNEPNGTYLYRVISEESNILGSGEFIINK